MGKECTCPKGYIGINQFVDGFVCIKEGADGLPDTQNFQTVEPTCKVIDDKKPQEEEPTQEDGKKTINNKQKILIALAGLGSLVSLKYAYKFYKEGVTLLAVSLLLIPIGVGYVIYQDLKNN